MPVGKPQASRPHFPPGPPTLALTSPRLETVYRSRVDRGTILIVVASSLAIGSLSAYFAVIGDIGMVVVTLPALIAGAGVPLWLLTTTHYVLSDSRLIVRSGPLRWEVPLEDITGIEPTRSPLAAPALSIDRIRICYGRGKAILISPRRRERFLCDLEARRSPTT